MAVVLVLASACGRVGYDAHAGIDASAPPLDGGAFVAFGPAEPLSELNGATHTHAPSLTADLLEIFFESTREGSDEIWRATRASVDVPFGTPELVTELSSASSETSPEVSADGLQIWFVSTRSPTLGDYDVWTARRTARDAPWNPPEHVIELSSRFTEHGAAPSPDTLAIVVHSNRAGTGDLFIATRAAIDELWSTPEPVVEVNTEGIESGGHLGAGLTALYFASNRTGSLGRNDLFVSLRDLPTDPFGPPQPIGGVNTADLEDEPWVSPDGTRLFFARDDGVMRGLYEAPRVR